VIPAKQHSGRNVPGGPDDNSALGRHYRVEHVGQEWAAAEIKPRLVGAAEPGGGAAGENNGVEGQDHATYLRRPQVVPGGLRYP
jgi:hypothetical protein